MALQRRDLRAIEAAEGLLVKQKRPGSFLSRAFRFNCGDDLLSHTLSRTVQSALRGLTSVFGMGTGGTPAVRSPQSHPRFARAISTWHLANSQNPVKILPIANCYLPIADFINARHQSGSTGVFPAQRVLFSKQGPKVLKELEDNASQLEPSCGRLSPQAKS
jgi:hypothetical protein